MGHGCTGDKGTRAGDASKTCCWLESSGVHSLLLVRGDFGACGIPATTWQAFLLDRLPESIVAFVHSRDVLELDQHAWVEQSVYAQALS
jgi:hypothetical protein